MTYNDALLHLTAGTLPPDFGDWGMKDENGTPLAHFAAMHSLLPAGFDGWEIESDRGVTTMRMLIGVGADVPEGFDHWFRLVDGRRTVIECARYFRNARLVAKFEAWELDQGVQTSRPVRALIRRPQA